MTDEGVLLYSRKLSHVADTGHLDRRNPLGSVIYKLSALNICRLDSEADYACSEVSNRVGKVLART